MKSLRVYLILQRYRKEDPWRVAPAHGELGVKAYPTKAAAQPDLYNTSRYSQRGCVRLVEFSPTSGTLSLLLSARKPSARKEHYRR